MTNVKVKESVNYKTNEEVSKIAVTTITSFGVIVGSWAAASLISGLMVAGGLFGLIKSFFIALGL